MFLETKYLVPSSKGNILRKAVGKSESSQKGTITLVYFRPAKWAMGYGYTRLTIEKTHIRCPVDDKKGLISVTYLQVNLYL